MTDGETQHHGTAQLSAGQGFQVYQQLIAYQQEALDLKIQTINNFPESIEVSEQCQNRTAK